MAKYYTLFFEARGIQSYIFDSGKMKEMVGASELVKELCDSKLDEVIKYLELEEIIPQKKEDASKLKEIKEKQIFFSRRSGGVFTAIFANKDNRDRFLALWSSFVTTIVPGLETVCAVSESEDDNIQKLINETYDILGYNRNCPPPILPEATPMHVLAPRTGKPAAENKFTADGIRIWTDEVSIVKQDIVDSGSLATLSKAFLSEKYKNYKFPKNLEFDNKDKEAFPFRRDSRYLGLIHADGNGLGQSLIQIRESFTNGAEYAVMLRLFSDSLEKATKEAAQAATAKLIEKYGAKPCVLPMRPLVLGGDDLTVLVRADYAMQFTEDYCKAFEETTKDNFNNLYEASGHKIPKKLTACAGIAYIKNNQPFIDAFELAESLCSASKKVSKDVYKKEKRDSIPASTTSLVVTNSFIESYETFKEKELTIDKKYIATLGTYAFNDDESSIPKLKDLRNLCNELKKDGVTPSSIRQYATMIFGDENISREKWRRWMEILGKNPKVSGGDLINSMQMLGIDKPKESPWTKGNTTPIFDALQLLSMEDTEEDKNV
ncbi:MAG: hypothetical protein IKQ61_08965 [Spirochaetales bacterium]|nr:hypothetical protein [Spirochaetales bacterium]